MIISRQLRRRTALLLLAISLLAGVAVEAQAQGSKKVSAATSRKRRAAAARLRKQVARSTRKTTSQSPPIIIVGPKNMEAPAGEGTGGGTGVAAPVVVADDPQPPRQTVEGTPKSRTLSVIAGGVLNGKAISKPQPPYPPIAKAARAQGTVTVRVLVDEEGNVISASAVSGHPLLQQAAVSAARLAKFSPTRLSGQPVKVSGVVTYNFVLGPPPSENGPHTR
jgi:TonB family protein